MKKPNVTSFVKNTQTFFKKHNAEILMGVGIGGMFTTIGLAVTATPKAIKLIEAEKKAKEVEQLTPIETVKVCWKPYIPAALTCVASTACLIGSSSLSAKRTTVIATAYNLSQTAFAEYRDKVIETIGEQKERMVRDKVAEEQLKKHPVDSKEIIITGTGKTRCLDSVSGRRFESDIESLRRVENILNKQLNSHDYVSLNELYAELNLDTLYPFGEDLGWNIEDGLIEFQFSSQLDTDGIPCLVLNYNYAPRYDYSKYL